MLRLFLDSAIADVGATEVVPLPAAGRFDAVLICTDTPADRVRPAADADRIIVIPINGDRLWIMRNGKVEQTIRNVSSDTISASLRGDPVDAPAARRPWRWFGASRSEPAGAPTPPPRPSPGGPNAWLAARLLSAGRSTLPPEAVTTLERLGGVRAAGRTAPDPRMPGLDRVVAAFGLDSAAADLLLAAALVETSPEAARLVALLGGSGGSRRMVLGHVGALGLEPAGFLARLQPDAPLIDYGLVSLRGDGPLVTRDIALPPDVTAAARR
jgi:hypothetical protein